MKKFLARAGLTTLLSALPLLIPKDSSTDDFRKAQYDPIDSYIDSLSSARTIGEQIRYSNDIASFLIGQNNEIMNDSTITSEEASVFRRNYKNKLEEAVVKGEGNPQFLPSLAQAYRYLGIYSLSLEDKQGFDQLDSSRAIFGSAFEGYYVSINSGNVLDDSDKTKLHDAAVSAGLGYYQTSYDLALNFLKQAESFAGDKDSLDIAAVREYYGLAKGELDNLYLSMKGIYSMKLTGINPQWRSSLSFDDNKLQELYQRLGVIGYKTGVYGEK